MSDPCHITCHCLISSIYEKLLTSFRAQYKCKNKHLIPAGRSRVIEPVVLLFWHVVPRNVWDVVYRQAVVNVAPHTGPFTVGMQVDQAWNHVGGESHYESLGEKQAQDLLMKYLLLKWKSWKTKSRWMHSIMVNTLSTTTTPESYTFVIYENAKREYKPAPENVTDKYKHTLTHGVFPRHCFFILVWEGSIGFFFLWKHFEMYVDVI